ncbi:acetyl-CoA carboxylase biotin carboxylase subunit [Altericroceibacterium spongiae]|uniref:biotin carboxylase n=1 Tax=Altericroceibacterium spongiae TaxID=2320269 RepID=A0A420ECE1_9SPHN|nr:acetyl-CoA carboxylase biotin carboxylase subunit [Altericroceibacterium spongiae]RKF18345.1 acetyl-CoA carboxylase biotin carboxylase subunit [Altericroceibacterium spongiae]
MTIRRIFIANRGEIACRIIRSCDALGVETVLGVSEADRHSLGTKLASRTVCLGPAPSAKSYLQLETVMQAAISTGCDAIHPGYGFLSERADLARMCEEEGILFIGPTASQIDAVGDKLRARTEAQAANVPVVPGGPVESREDAKILAEEVGLPLLVKAVGGGGGRGMKLVEKAEELHDIIDMASAEAGAAFGDSRIYLERYVAKGRHVEVQLLGDGKGHVIHCGERDCSVQRRYQKLIEESPAPHLPDDLRENMLAAACRFAARLDYRGAGTVEFLYDVDRREFYFLEMNARIQVEHPVTEEVTGIDLIAEQIAIANGEGLRFGQSDIRFTGHAMECRINAEDPEENFMPSPGIVQSVQWPAGEGIRVDTHIVNGAQIPPFYDSMIAKIVAHGPDRQTALARLRDALMQTHIEGVATNCRLQTEILADPAFIKGGVNTSFLAELLTERKEMA